MSKKYRTFSRTFKLKVVRDRLQGKAVAELVRQYDIHANLVYNWVAEYSAHPETAFRTASDKDAEAGTTQHTVAELEQMVGRLTMENDFLKKALAHAERTVSGTPQVIPPIDGAKG